MKCERCGADVTETVDVRIQSSDHDLSNHSEPRSHAIGSVDVFNVDAFSVCRRCWATHLMAVWHQFVSAVRVT
jgi:hypothetical protein